ncbi:helix-turn-helix transcriptional regulator [Geomonas limicola]|uniref:helix-turn-helix transcriptional regulator n=1 Tax=Geomonas limicola TaxID=2740186 RepID=UPI00160F6E40|nr:AlpA family phage regulatory protein [Geomonas limicola]
MTYSPAVIPPSKIREVTGLSRTTVWRLERLGQFPHRIRLSPGRVGYRRSEIESWLAVRQAVVAEVE